MKIHHPICLRYPLQLGWLKGWCTGQLKEGELQLNWRVQDEGHAVSKNAQVVKGQSDDEGWQKTLQMKNSQLIIFAELLFLSGFSCLNEVGKILNEVIFQ